MKMLYAVSENRKMNIHKKSFQIARISHKNCANNDSANKSEHLKHILLPHIRK